MYKVIKNNRGSALVLVLICLLVLTILGASIFTLALSNTRSTMRQENAMKAYFIAHSGAMTLAEHIIENPEINVEDMILAGPTSEIDIADSKVQVKVDKVDEELIISSTGISNGVSQNVEVILEKSAGDIGNYAILAGDSIRIHNHVTVIGGVATNNSKVSTSPHARPKADDITKNAGINIPEIDWPTKFNQVINNKITGGESISVSGNKSVHLAQGVDLSNKSKLSLTGSGILHLYVSNGWKSANHTELQVDEGLKVIIYSNDGGDFHIRSHKFSGIIYAPKSKVTFHNASGSSNGVRKIYGSIIAKEINLDGNHTTLEYNPDYSFGDLTLKTGYRIKETR